MNIYKLTRRDKVLCDEYESAIVVAPDATTARSMHPRHGGNISPVDTFTDWPRSPLMINVEPIGVALPRFRQGVLLAAYNG